MPERLRRLVEVLCGESGAVAAETEDLFDVTTAYATMGAAGYDAVGRAGLCFSVVDSVAFEGVLAGVDDLVALSTETPGAGYETVDDDHGYRWVVIEDLSFDDLATTVHAAADAVIAEGYSEYLLCGAFAFEYEGDRRAYLLYNFSRGAWYPFVPTDDQGRDADRERELADLVGGEVDLEGDPDRWYPFWSIPI